MFLGYNYFMAKYTKKEVEILIKEINSAYEFTGEYINNATPLRLKHLACGKTIKRTLGSFKKTQKCPHCQNGRNKWNTKKVKVYIDDVTNGEYSLVSEYKHFKEYIAVRHNKCENEYQVSFDAFKSGNRCPRCGREKITKKQLKSQSDFEREVAELTNNMFEVVSEYKGAFKEVELFHKKCGKNIRKIPHNFLNRPSCPNCGGFSTWNTDEYNEHVMSITDGEYCVIGEYVSDKKGKVTFNHKKCGRNFQMLSSNFVSGEQRCPFCKMNVSKAENKIRKLLEQMKVDFIEQYRFHDCTDKSTLPFDFAIIDKGNVIGLIEYDGIQHFRGWGNNKDDLLSIKKRDEIKNNYCHTNRIPLFRINYKSYSELENKIKEAINWIQQQNMLKESSPGTS